MSNTAKVLAWVENNTHPDGGMRCWTNGPIYPEITGYLIPTLLAHGKDSLAHQFADWLEAHQNQDGSFYGLHGGKAVFDTSACYEGLRAAGRHLAASRARIWIESQPKGNEIYLTRAYALLGKLYEPDIPPNPRAHYCAYMLEGLQMLGQDVTGAVELLGNQRHTSGLMPFELGKFGGDCIPATAQMAMLYKRCGLDNSVFIEALDRVMLDDGGLTHNSSDKNQAISWAAKFYLDAML